MSEQVAEKWNTAAIVLAAICLLLLAFAEALGLSSSTVRYVLVGGFFVSGTIMWVVQSRKICPHCGKRFGLSIRLLKPYQCKHCRGDIREEFKGG